MLTADLVRVRRRGGEISVVPLGARARTRACELAGRYVAAAAGLVGGTRQELALAFDAVETSPRERKLAAGLRKLVEDRCEMAVDAEIDPAELRRDVFLRAAAERRALGPGERLDTAAVLGRVAAARELDGARLAALLYADLREAHRVLSFSAATASDLVDQYVLSQQQAVLLRATRVTAEIREASPADTRALFRKLKFLRLLHRIERLDDGYRIEIDGPLSLFSQSTRYGLALALALPSLRACGRWTLDAEVRWGRDRAPATFRLKGEPQGRVDEPGLSPEVAELLGRWPERGSRFSVRVATEPLTLPGIGECIPDLVFEDAAGGDRIFLEALGFWSRDAVWKRVALVEQGLATNVLFAVPARLRVSEEVLPDDLPSALYVYRGTLRPKAVEERLERLAARTKNIL